SGHRPRRRAVIAAPSAGTGEPRTRGPRRGPCTSRTGRPPVPSRQAGTGGARRRTARRRRGTWGTRLRGRSCPSPVLEHPVDPVVVAGDVGGGLAVAVRAADVGDLAAVRAVVDLLGHPAVVLTGFAG